MFVGIRPLVKSGDGKLTAALSRDHTIHIDASGLLTTTGGKWTTYRNMAEHTVDQAADLARLTERPCVTRTLNVHGFHTNADRFGALSIYGSDALAIQELIRETPSLGAPLHADLPYTGAEVVWATRHEMARTVEDVLARRTRALFLNARAAIAMAPGVARLMAGGTRLGCRAAGGGSGRIRGAREGLSDLAPGTGYRAPGTVVVRARAIDYHRAVRASPTLATPNASLQRIECLDILRGFALLGMFVVHFHMQSTEPGGFDDMVRVLVWRLVETKSHGTFALLFGAGFAIQLRRAEAQGRPFAGLYLRRLAVLALFGFAAHAFFGYNVLLGYAVWALPLLVIRTVVDARPAGDGSRLGRVRRALFDSHDVVVVPSATRLCRSGGGGSDEPRGSPSMTRSMPPKCRRVISSCWARASGTWPGSTPSRSS